MREKQKTEDATRLLSNYLLARTGGSSLGSNVGPAKGFYRSQLVAVDVALGALYSSLPAQFRQLTKSGLRTAELRMWRPCMSAVRSRDNRGVGAAAVSCRDNPRVTVSTSLRWTKEFG